MKNVPFKINNLLDDLELHIAVATETGREFNMNKADEIKNEIISEVEKMQMFIKDESSANRKLSKLSIEQNEEIKRLRESLRGDNE